ncbi:hypothetical protein AWC38_SpisGene6678 [Stylophora pistillata]|uniref:Uncharacterized protein n=1 Tax=Stylophora pistillata TaxID=50429 RepID=A0A2B4SJ41_STYPI|nr:hypothetical protein AWC38_SpisGene6678 [Stylophora pistillata]
MGAIPYEMPLQRLSIPLVSYKEPYNVTSVRTSVQGLDYVSAAGAEEFDDLCDVVETFGDVGQGMGWAKQQKNNLRASKRYIKSDFKDNAGCYHCGTTLICAAALGHEDGVKIRRLDFSDPQGGKSACDRKVATIKSHMRIYLNAGNDIEKSEQMRDAILSSGRVPGVNVALCETVQVPRVLSSNIEGNSQLSNVENKEEGLLVWRTYGIGDGKLIPTDKLHCPSPSELPTLTGVTRSYSSAFTSAKERRIKASVRDPDPPVHIEEEDSNAAIFRCPEEGFVKTFVTGFFSRLAVRKSLFNDDDLEEEIECATQEATIKELTNEVSRELLQGRPIVWDAATLLSTKVVDFILAGSKEKGLQYIGGYVLHKLHNKLANSKKSPEIEQAISILKAGKSDDQAVSDSQRLTSSLNRGGLWTITKNTQTIFERAEHYFRDITSKADIRKLDCTDIISRSTHDIDVVSAYHLILSDAELTAESTVAKDVLHNIIQLYVRVRSFSFAKDIIQKHKVQAKQLKSKALRKEISRACKESENDRQS